MSKSFKALRFLESLRKMLLAGSSVQEMEWKRNRQQGFYEFKIRITASDEIRNRVKILNDEK